MDRDDKVVMLLGEVKGELRGVARGMRSMARQQELMRVELIDQGKRMSALPCHHHRKQLSDLMRSVGQVREDSQVLHIRDIERRKIWRAALDWSWRIGRVVLPVALTGGGIMAAIAALQCGV